MTSYHSSMSYQGSDLLVITHAHQSWILSVASAYTHLHKYTWWEIRALRMRYVSFHAYSHTSRCVLAQVILVSHAFLNAHKQVHWSSTLCLGSLSCHWHWSIFDTLQYSYPNTRIKNIKLFAFGWCFEMRSSIPSSISCYRHVIHTCWCEFFRRCLRWRECLLSHTAEDSLWLRTW